MYERIGNKPMPAEDRFWGMFEQSEGCWEWGNIKDGAYGSIIVDGKGIQAHNFSYRLLVGEIPEGLELDHLCENKRCVNPDHLEPVTHAENTRRAKFKRRKTHCFRGHELSGDNLYWFMDNTQGYRRSRCRPCGLIRARIRSNKLKQLGTDHE